ncbi:MAG: hypothetical protein GY711_15835 [bacterium]|nr:hypothetical protein [bacterium]
MRFHSKRLLSAAVLLSTSAFAQVAVEDFEIGNTHNWGLEFGTSATHHATGGNPNGRIELRVASSQSVLPAAIVLPAAAGHPWSGDFRAQDVSSFSYDREVLGGSSNFGTRPYLVLGRSNGTMITFLDDTWVFVAGSATTTPA